MNWHFLKKKYVDLYSLNARKGWLRLSPDSLRTSIVQKETDHYYSAITKIIFDATDSTSKAGIYLSNGDQSTIVQLYSGYDKDKKIFFSFEKNTQSIPNTFGDTVWLKVVRNQHELTAYCSGDGTKWTTVGSTISVVNLDKTQPRYSWVGTSLGLFTENKAADFDFFICKDGFTKLPAVGYNNYYGIEKTNDEAVTNDSENGGWFMISGIELGEQKVSVKGIEMELSAKTNGKVEIWLDDLKTGKLIATIPYTATGGDENWKTFSSKVLKNISGHHDVFVKFPTGAHHDLIIKTLKFTK